MSQTRCRPRMLSHVISIPFIALHSTHTALQLPQSPLLPCRRNISFPANSYPLKRRKFHIYRDECKFADSLSRSTLICQIPCRMQYLSPLETQTLTHSDNLSFFSGCLTRFGTPSLIIKKYMKTYIFGTYIQETYTRRLNLYLLPPSIKPSFR